MKLKGYTLTEIIIVMLLSAVIIGACYETFLIFNRHFIRFKNVNNAIMEVSRLSDELSSDMSSSICVLENANLITCKSKNINREYRLNKFQLIKKQNLNLDTFQVRIDSIDYTAIEENKRFLSRVSVYCNINEVPILIHCFNPLNHLSETAIKFNQYLTENENR